jgi:hypothetical protein
VRRARRRLAAAAILYTRRDKACLTRRSTRCSTPTPEDKTVKGLKGGDFTEADEPFALFGDWLDEATASEPNDPNAMALATVDETGLPNVRMVLLKGFDENGFVFYTNTESNKGRELLGQGKAAICLHWKSLRRQVRARGPVTVVDDAEADAYFQSRPPRQPHRRLGEPAVAPPGEPLRPGEGGRGPCGAVCRGRGAPPAALDGLSHLAREHRVLAGPPLPAARPGRVHPRGRRLEPGAALSVRLPPVARDHA